ncbi:helix-turn-helix transcriptional regulator, partial [Candidatus Bathyarchaeota archaeon]|nr:helix-turn-helix transcriptional regulator [Candidatus Bathyarchaeota archaeon]
ILKELDNKPMHGYEIIKALGEEFGGPFRPSAGAIYPTLQALKNEGLIKGEETDDKRVYTITPEGLRVMKEEENKLKEVIESRKTFIQERKGLNIELRNFASLIMTNYRDLTPEKAEKIGSVLQDARKKINDIIFE